MGINLEIYLEQQHMNDNGGQEIERTRLSRILGRGEYIIRGGNRLFVKGYETIDGDSVRQVTLGFREDKQHVIELDTTGIGRMHIPPDQWLVVQDNTILEEEILPN